MTILFFDGECGLCDRLVTFLAARDRGDRLRFAPLGGETAARELSAEVAREDSAVLLSGNSVALRSDAALGAIAALGGAWRLAGALKILPRGLRDGVYRWVATHRKRVFGAPSCALPTAALRAKLLP